MSMGLQSRLKIFKLKEYVFLRKTGRIHSATLAIKVTSALHCSLESRLAFQLPAYCNNEPCIDTTPEGGREREREVKRPVIHRGERHP